MKKLPQSTRQIRKPGRPAASALAAALAAASALAASALAAGPAPRAFEVRDDKPASRWEYAYPVGNGRLGAMPFGACPAERILLTEETIWQGRKFARNPDDSGRIIREARALLWQGKPREAQSLIARKFLASEPRHRAVQPLGFLTLAYTAPGGAPAEPARIRRRLSLNDAVASSEFLTKDGLRVRQEVFASRPDDVVAVRIRSLDARPLSLAIGLERYEDDEVRAAAGGALILTGQACHRDKDGKKSAFGTRFLGMAKAASDGTVTAEGRALRVSGARELLLLIAAATDYDPRNPLVPLENDREKICRGTIARAERLGFAKLLERHLADHRPLFRRASIDLGATDADALKMTTPERLERARNGGRDPDLLEDLFQMGRYLLIASSRPGTLPPALAGIWNGNRSPKCDADWHANINMQQNYWHAETAGLGDLHLPFIALLDDIRRGMGRETARKLGCRGFVLSHATHGWKQSVFSGHPFWGMWPLGGAWCCSHVMEHYRFSGDRDYLRATAYPILRDNALFCLDWLSENPKTGELVSGPSGSPENAFHPDAGKGIVNICMGPAIDRQIIRESFTDFLEASAELGLPPDDAPARDVRRALGRLAGTEIAPDGRILEWDKPYREWQVSHRHYSHLYALYPGCAITPATPALFAAAAKSIEARQTGGGVFEGWSRAWLANLYARLLDREKAYGAVRRLLEVHTMPNLLHGQSPWIFKGRPQPRRQFNFDGNAAGTAAVIEMLLQSHGPGHVVRLLPCLPAEWADGSFEGLCARGAFALDLKWSGGKPRDVRILSKAGNPFRLEAPAGTSVRTAAGVPVRTSWKNGILSFDTVKGAAYRVKMNESPAPAQRRPAPAEPHA